MLNWSGGGAGTTSPASLGQPGLPLTLASTGDAMAVAGSASTVPASAAGTGASLTLSHDFLGSCFSCSCTAAGGPAASCTHCRSVSRSASGPPTSGRLWEREPARPPCRACSPTSVQATVTSSTCSRGERRFYRVVLQWENPAFQSSSQCHTTGILFALAKQAPPSRSHHL